MLEEHDQLRDADILNGVDIVSQGTTVIHRERNVPRGGSRHSGGASRRRFLTGAAAAVSTIPAAGCLGPHVAPPGHHASYTSRVLTPQRRNTVFDWVEAVLQQVRDVLRRAQG